MNAGTWVAVAGTSELSAAAGLRLAEEGGNAVDAALAAVLVSMVTEPGVCAPGAGAFVAVAPADGSPPVVVDGNVEMPGRGLPPERIGKGLIEVVTGYGGGTRMLVGHGSVATPGALAALELAHGRYGRAPWRSVVAPVVEAAAAGFPLPQASHYYLRYVHEDVFGITADGWAAVHDAEGRLLDRGAPVHVPHLVDSLTLIAEEGIRPFYRGDLATAIATDMAENEGLLTAADLAAYRPTVGPALGVDLHAWRLWTNPPPAIGGVSLAAMLVLMAGRPRGAWTADDLEHLVRVQQAVLGYRAAELDLTEDRVTAATRLLELVGTGDLAGLCTAPSTVNVSVVDAEGGACAVTSSAGYGSGVMTPGTGLWLNNCLGEPELTRRGLPALTPGERLASNMAPTVGRHPDGSVLAIGSPGADRITTALLQVLAVFAAGAPLEDAISAPRLHVRLGPAGPVVEHEADLVPPPLGLLTREHHRHAMYFGGVGAALRRDDGTLLAAGDPRRAAAVAVSAP